MWSVSLPAPPWKSILAWTEGVDGDGVIARAAVDEDRVLAGVVGDRLLDAVDVGGEVIAGGPEGHGVVAVGRCR